MLATVAPPWLYSTAEQQAARHAQMAARFQATYTRVKAHDYQPWVVPFWSTMERNLEQRLLPLPGRDFLCDDFVRGMMFVFGGRTDFECKLNTVRTLPAVAAEPAVAGEDWMGQPEILGSEFQTSHNTIHHLYHLTEYINETGANLHDINTVFEWGGGYGNMAKLLHRVLERPLTYVLVDLPLLTCLQWLYLGSVLGEDRVHLVERPGDTLSTGKINLLPVSLLQNHWIEADLFLSTWALSESSRQAQEYVVQHGWFGARRLLLGYQKDDIHRDEFVCPDVLEHGVRTLGGIIKPFPFGEGQHYGFA